MRTECERSGHVVRSQNVGSCARCGAKIDYGDPAKIAKIPIPREKRLHIVHTALDAVPCRCSDAYYERGMVAPDCDHHDLAYELRGWAVCNCTPCQRLRDADA